jgi:dihydroorotate dehydrogenase
VNGLKKIELIDLAATHKISTEAFEIFKNTSIGLSVLQNENYREISKALKTFSYSFIELNWKYTFRTIDYSNLTKEISKIFNDLKSFIDAFKGNQCIVKLSREVLEPSLISLLNPIFEFLTENNIPIVIANSKRFILPPSKTSAKESLREYNDGVVIGEYLFLETFNWVKRFKLMKNKGTKVPPIIASGGLTDIRSIIDIIAAGAEAVQLCTAFDRHGVHFLDTLREELEYVIEDYSSFEEFKNAIQSNDSEWLRCASKAEKVVSSAESKVFDIINLNDQILTHLKNAVTLELGHSKAETDSPCLKIGTESKQEDRFMINLSSVGIYLLAEEAVSKYHFFPIDYAFSKELSFAFKHDSTQYDFALIPKSTLTYLQSEPASTFGSNFPIEIGKVGVSAIELIGDGRMKLNEIKTIYYFGGLSSRYAINILLKEVQPNIELIKPKEVLPLLRSWNSNFGIMVDYPLSRIYSHFVSPEIEKYWAPLWSERQDIVLVASLNYYQAPNGRVNSNKVLKQLKELANEISADPNVFARNLFSKGFISNFCSLFGLEQKTRINI